MDLSKSINVVDPEGSGSPTNLRSGRVERDGNDTICSSLGRIGLRPIIPQGAYYVLADVSSLPGKGSKEKSMFLLERTGVASVPGESFYHDEGGENLARFCFAKEDYILDEACRRIEALRRP